MTETVRHRIVLVDDERVAMRTYQQELELTGYEVWHYTSTAEVERLLASMEPERVDLFVLDIMMPPEPLYSAEKTDVGLRTGLFLAQDIREKYPHTPIIFLSNASFEWVLAPAKRLTSRLQDCIFLRKHDTLPFELADIVTKYFHESKLHPGRRRRILRRLFGSLMLQPNFSGIGIDLRKLSNDD